VLRKKGNGFVLLLETRQSEWKLDARRPLAVQILAPEVIRVEPAFFTELDWKGKSEIPIRIQDGSPGKTYSLSVQASYTVCSSRTKVCKKSRSGTAFNYWR
jgi:hypothetical protein